MILEKLLFAAALLWAGTAGAAGVDPLTAEIDARDAIRFAELMKDGAIPTAEVLQHGYLERRLGMQVTHAQP